MDKRHNITPQITDVVNAARAKKDEIAKTTPYGWNEYRRLHCLSLVSKYLGDGKQNPGQLLNVHAVIAAYKAAKGQADIKWKHWSVSYWAQGNQIKEDVFRWDDCLGRLSKANALQQSLWIESADPAGPLPFRRFYGSPPSTPGSTFTIALNLVIRVPGAVGKEIPITFGTATKPLLAKELTPPVGIQNPGQFFMQQIVGGGQPECMHGGSSTTILISPGMLAQSEAAAGSLAPELGYSVFHCGNEVLEVYRAVVLEVGLADIEPQSTDIYWIKSRCAVSTRLGADPIRLLYNRNDISMWGDMIALEVEEDEVTLGVDGVDGADGIDKDGSDMEIDR